MVFLCAKCLATWRVLPAFLARCLLRTGEVVEAAVFEGDHPVAARTVQRSHARLTQAALVAAQALATSGDPALRAVAQNVGLAGSRDALVKAYSAAIETPSLLAPLAALLHRSARGCVSCSARGTSAAPRGGRLTNPFPPRMAPRTSYVRGMDEKARQQLALFRISSGCCGARP